MQIVTLNACRQFVAAIIAAKGRRKSDDDEGFDEFLKDREAERRYTEVYKSIRREFGDVAFGWEISRISYKTSAAIWETENPDAEAMLTDFVNSIVDSVDELSLRNWVGCFPLQCRFEGFPTFTEFGDFAIINARASYPENNQSLFDAFRRILTEHFEVNFANSPEIQNSYLDLAEHWFSNKTSGYIPGRPLMILRMGRGELSEQTRRVERRFSEYGDLLYLVGIAYDLDSKRFETRKLSEFPCFPDSGNMLPEGLIAIPSVGLAIDVSTGSSQILRVHRLNSGSVPYMESDRRKRYEAPRFLDSWRQIAEPILRLGKQAVPLTFTRNIENGIRLVARAWDPAAGDIVLSSIIATESLLCPRKDSEIKFRFSQLVAMICTIDPVERRSIFQRAKSLYNYRCSAVHRAEVPAVEEKSEPESDRVFAVKVYLKCLLRIVNWAEDRTSRGLPVNEKAFDDFYMDYIFPVGRESGDIRVSE